MGNNSANKLFDVTGRVVVVTGGLGQLGRGFCQALLDAGAKVAALDLQADDKAMKAAFAELAASGDLIGVSGDVTSKRSMQAALGEVRAKLGEPWGLINNAALDSPPDAPAEETGPFESYPVSSWEKVMRVNTQGVLVASQVFGGAMAEGIGGSIINIGSIYGVVSPDQNLYQYRRDRGEEFYKPVAYAASKSALYNLTRYMAGYWGPKNVRTNILTFAGVFNHQDETFLEGYGKKIPLRRGEAYAAYKNMAATEDYVGAVVYLISDASSYMTGADLRIDGGYTAL